jgi:hypothetical protein
MKRTYYTADGVEIVDGLWVWDYDLHRGRVDFAATLGLNSPHFDGWFRIRRHDTPGHSLMNGERLSTRHPATREPADKPDRGFPADIVAGPYTNANGGLSAQVDHVTVVGDEVPDYCRLSLPTDLAPSVILAETAPGYRVLRPAEPTGTDWMASGAYVHSRDSRWKDLAGTRLPLPLHDRTEHSDP